MPTSTFEGTFSVAPSTSSVVPALAVLSATIASLAPGSSETAETISLIVIGVYEPSAITYFMIVPAGISAPSVPPMRTVSNYVEAGLPCQMLPFVTR